MTCSMTAFARASQTFDGCTFSWEIKSVNHRYLDMSFRMPEALRFMELSLRQRIAEKLTRGKIECNLRFDQSQMGDSFDINANLVRNILMKAQGLSTEFHIANDLSVSHLITSPGVLVPTVLDEQRLMTQAKAVFDQALMQLIDMRETEGLALEKQIVQRLDLLDLQIQKARGYSETFAVQTKEKLLARLSSLSSALDMARFEQEVALLLTKMDISEEIDRLEVHVQEIRNVLKNTQATGRRLDFYMQELNRETNTICSKSDMSGLTSVAVEMKVIIEQMREQIQNIE